MFISRKSITFHNNYYLLHKMKCLKRTKQSGSRKNLDISKVTSSSIPNVTLASYKVDSTEMYLNEN